jgi:hypothetical protein
MLTSAWRQPHGKPQVAPCGRWRLVTAPRHGDAATQQHTLSRRKPLAPATWRVVAASSQDVDVRAQGRAGRQVETRGAPGVAAEHQLASSSGWPWFTRGFPFSIRFSDPAHGSSSVHPPRVRFLLDFHLHRLRLLPLHAIVPCGASWLPSGAWGARESGQKHLSLAYKYEGRGKKWTTSLHPRMRASLLRRGLSLVD